MNSFAALVLLALGANISFGASAVVAIQRDTAKADALAPDGKRGFGMDLGQKQLTELLRSKDDADRAFFEELTQLATTTRVQLLIVRQHYVERGYFRFLPGSAGDDLAGLHIAYAKSVDAPGPDLKPGDPRSKSLAAMLVDTRFNVRRDLMLRAQVAVDDLDHARAVFLATQTGYVSLTPAEIGHIAARADLAAAEIRALRSDLEALTPSTAEKEPADEDLKLARHLLELARIRDEVLRASELKVALSPRRELESRMQGLLFSARIDPKLVALREWRERAMLAAAGVRTKVLEMVPDTKEGEKARPEIARLKKTERMNIAYGMAIEGLANDPLDPELAWAAGHARQLAWPGLDAIIYFDRFLALMGIRTSDANPANGRKFSPREQEAYAAVVTFKR